MEGTGLPVCVEETRHPTEIKNELSADPGNHERIHSTKVLKNRTCTAAGERRPTWTGIQHKGKCGGKNGQVMLQASNPNVTRAQAASRGPGKQGWNVRKKQNLGES